MKSAAESAAEQDDGDGDQKKPDGANFLLPGKQAKLSWLVGAYHTTTVTEYRYRASHVSYVYLEKGEMMRCPVDCKCILG